MVAGGKVVTGAVSRPRTENLEAKPEAVKQKKERAVKKPKEE